MKKLILILNLICINNIFAMQPNNNYQHCEQALRAHDSKYFKEFSDSLTEVQVEKLIILYEEECKKIKAYDPAKVKMTEIISALILRKLSFNPPAEKNSVSPETYHYFHDL